jgi:predicted metal-binding membrane protein
MFKGDKISVELLLRLLRHRRAVVAGALVAVIAAAWGYLLLGAGIEMEMGGGRMVAMAPVWNLPYAVLILVMWVAMMIAMMLPTAAPTVLLVTVLASDRVNNSNLVPVAAMLFASGYFLVWCGFGLGATLLQWGLDKAGLLSATMRIANEILAGTVLIAAGIYQWTPLKDTCLRHCRSPTEFLARHWRRGMLGAVRTGVRHGLFCLGCCWMLMSLSFVGGLMNLAWVGAIALFVLVEKSIPSVNWMSWLTGALLVVWGTGSLIL